MEQISGTESQEMNEGLLTPQEINRIYNDHRHAIHRANGYPESAMIDDDLGTLVYPRDPGTMGMKQSLILEAIESYTNVVPYDKEAYESLMQRLFTSLEQKSAIIVTNHATFANIPILVTELHKYAKQYHKKDIRDRINTIVGPALLTQSQKTMGLAITNLWKTIPATKQSEIPALDEAMKTGRISEHPLQRIKKDFVTNFISAGAQPGNIFLIAPTGTRDVLERSPYKQIQSISFGDDDKVQNTLKAISHFVDQGNMIILAGINETVMKTPGFVHEKNHSRTKGTTHLDMKEITVEQCDQLIKDKEFMSELASLVRNNFGNSIGHALPEDQLKAQEANAKERFARFSDPLYQTYEFNDLTFVDTVRKKIVRGLFEMFADH